MIILLCLAFGVLALVDLPRLIKEKSWRELTVYSIILALAFSLSLLRMLDVEVPNPVRDTQYAVQWLFEQIHLTYD